MNCNVLLGSSVEAASDGVYIFYATMPSGICFYYKVLLLPQIVAVFFLVVRGRGEE